MPYNTTPPVQITAEPWVLQNASLKTRGNLRVHTIPSPSQVKLFIGAVYLDDALSVNCFVQDNKIPIYGYDQRNFKRVANGRTFVQGSLVINFRTVGALTRAILESNMPTERAYENLHESWADTLGYSSLAELNRRLEQDATGTFQELISKGETVNLADVSTVMRNIHSRAAGDRTRSTLDYGAIRHSRPGNTQFEDRIDITIIYGTPDLEWSTTRRTEIIEGVQFVGQGKRISNQVPDGGQPILVEHQFIAENVRIA